uniref:Uncharacterized protein n=1 Tax=Arundo donax TaxID=35708 RepID=A0A0A8ZZN5_ARUDO
MILSGIGLLKVLYKSKKTNF